MMIEKIFVADLQKVSGNNERKICAVGVSKMLSECKLMTEIPHFCLSMKTYGDVYHFM